MEKWALATSGRNENSSTTKRTVHKINNNNNKRWKNALSLKAPKIERWKSEKQKWNDDETTTKKGRRRRRRRKLLVVDNTAHGIKLKARSKRNAAVIKNEMVQPL